MEPILAWYRTAGPLVVPLLLLQGAGAALLVDRFTYIVLRSRIHARPFMERVISLARSDKIDEALQVCAQHRSALPDLGLVILRSLGVDGTSERDLLNVAEASTLGVVPALTQRLKWLTTLAVVAVLLGLSGSVLNLHQGLMTPGRAIAESVAYGLRPLGIGLLTAVPLLLGHAYLASEAEKLIAQLEEFAARLINALIDRPDVRLGHRD